MQVVNPFPHTTKKEELHENSSYKNNELSLLCQHCFQLYSSYTLIYRASKISASYYLYV